MEKYLTTLLEQIRCKEARPYIESEIRMHMEDQIAQNLLDGMEQNEAVAAAVRDMGSPVESGIALDKIHRPAVCWDLLIFIGLISVLGILIHLFIGNTIFGGPERFAFHTLFGFVVMLIVYRLDYSFLASYAKWIAGGMILIELLVATTPLGLTVNGQTIYFSFGSVNFSMFSLMMLYVPIYGAVIYQYYGSGYTGLAKSFLWLILPCLISFKLPSFILAVILFYSMSVVLSLAVYKGWFKIAKKKFLLCFWSVLFASPFLLVISVYVFHWLAAYQEARITAFLTQSGDAYYVTGHLKDLLIKSQFIGGIDISYLKQFPDFDSSYIFTYLTSNYGILAGIMVCVILSYLIFKIFSISFHQKNQLGMMMGCGCGTVIGINSLLNIAQNLGILPFTQSFLPFFSSGGSTIIICYIMLGIVLSIYRYKNIFPFHFHQKPKLKFTVKIEKTNAL